MSSSSAVLLDLLDHLDVRSRDSESSVTDSISDDMILSSAANSPEVSRRSSTASPETNDGQTYESPLSIEPGEQGLSASLHINLIPYIESFNNNLLQHLRYKQEIINQLTSLGGAPIWLDMCHAALHGRVSDADMKMIQNSPIERFMQESFIELVKNVMDEAILGYLQDNKKPQLDLKLTISITDDHRIGVTLTDNGRGFSESFLQKVNTLDNIKRYVDQTGSVKLAADKPKPHTVGLFGGAGRGLRILMARLLYGDRLVADGVRKPEYIPSAVSAIVIDNSTDAFGKITGASIHMTTSDEPLQMHKIQQPSVARTPGVMFKLPTRCISAPFEESDLFKDNQHRRAISCPVSLQ